MEDPLGKIKICLGFRNCHYPAVKFVFVHQGTSFQPGLVDINGADGEIEVLGHLGSIVDSKPHQCENADFHRHCPILEQMNLHVLREKGIELIHPVGKQFQECGVEAGGYPGALLLYADMVQCRSCLVQALQRDFPDGIIHRIIDLIDKAGVPVKGLDDVLVLDFICLPQFGNGFGEGLVALLEQPGLFLQVRLNLLQHLVPAAEYQQKVN